ncbi:MAG: cell division protein ZapA [Sphingomonadales bacterium]
MSQELIPIAAQLGDRTYRIKVESQHEQLVLGTLKQINQKLLEFKTQYAGKDMQDYLAMTMLWYATQPAAPSAETSMPTPPDPAQESALAQELQLLEQLLDAEINKH